jgi:hypothetical protein
MSNENETDPAAKPATLERWPGGPPRRLKACVEAWPGCSEGEYNPACCRFPKSCSCDIYSLEHIKESSLEPVQDVAAGEHHAGTLNLTGQGNRAEADSSITDAMAEAAAKAMHVYDKDDPWDDEGCNDTGEPGFEFPSCKEWTTGMARAALEAALPAIRQQVAEELVAEADRLADEFQESAVAHRELAGDKESPKGQRHWRTAVAFRNKADGAWAVAAAAREIGGEG